MKIASFLFPFTFDTFCFYNNTQINYIYELIEDSRWKRSGYFHPYLILCFQSPFLLLKGIGQSQLRVKLGKEIISGEMCNEVLEVLTHETRHSCDNCVGSLV